jgi:hypothetical protein
VHALAKLVFSTATTAGGGGSARKDVTPSDGDASCVYNRRAVDLSPVEIFEMSPSNGPCDSGGILSLIGVEQRFDSGVRCVSVVAGVESLQNFCKLNFAKVTLFRRRTIHRSWRAHFGQF